MSSEVATMRETPGLLTSLVLSMTTTHGGFDFLIVKKDMKLVYLYLLSIILGVLFMDMFISPMIIIFLVVSCYHFGRDFEYLTLDSNCTIFGVMLVTGTVLSPAGSDTPFNLSEDDKPGLWIWFNTLESLGMEELAISKITEICMVIWLFTIVFTLATMKPKMVSLCFTMIITTGITTLPFLAMTYMCVIHVPIAVRSVEMVHGSLPVVLWFIASLLMSSKDTESFYTDPRGMRFGIPIVTTHVVTNYLWEKRLI